jgi:lysozyme
MQQPTASPAAAELIKQSEGLRLKAYLCPAGVPTIGYGHTSGVQLGMTCTREQAEQWLASDLAEFSRKVRAAVKVALTQAQFDALVSFAFNCKSWEHSTLIAKLNAGDYRGAAAEFPKWDHAHVNGRVVEEGGLKRRRAAEQALFCSDSGIMENKPAVGS